MIKLHINSANGDRSIFFSFARVHYSISNASESMHLYVAFSNDAVIIQNHCKNMASADTCTQL